MLAEAEDGRARLLMSAINAGEVYYFLRKHHNEALSESWRASAPTLPVRFDVPSADDIWNAACLKGRYPISYADAFVTGGPEFRFVEKLDLDCIG